MPQFIISTEAAKDIEHFRQYLMEQDSAAVSDQFLEAVYEKFNLLAKYPGMGRRRNDLSLGLFSFPDIKYRHSIFYKKIRKGIKILRVFGGYQNHQDVLKSFTIK